MIVIIDVRNIICHFVLYIEVMGQDMLLTREKECVVNVESLGAQKSA
jgi:hypothetical protein